MKLKLLNQLVIIIAITIGMLTSSVQASQSIKDQYPNSMLYSKPIEVIPNVWSAIGTSGPPLYDNAGHNNNLSFIVTGDGVIVINGGASYLLAKALHDEIKTITKQPVKLIINENGQGHAMLGNSYWAEQNVPILAHVEAKAEFKEHGYDSLSQHQNVIKEKSKGTKVHLPTETFEGKKTITMGAYTIEVINFGPAHSPGDISVWLPKQRLIITGDMAFHERLLAIFPDTEVSNWIESWDKMEKLKPLYVIPGHGHPTNLDQVRRYTKDYLLFLKGKVKKLIDAGGTLQDSYSIDQSPYAHLDTFKELAKKNAGRLFEQLEFE
ncbi:MAG: MBL fold metallo-hydrolase [Methyloligella sp.]|nr:MAG: MBL fold metallo-hydrolase [Methyloligella sp.]